MRGGPRCPEHGFRMGTTGCPECNIERRRKERAEGKTIMVNYITSHLWTPQDPRQLVFPWVVSYVVWER